MLSLKLIIILSHPATLALWIVVFAYKYRDRLDSEELFDSILSVILSAFFAYVVTVAVVLVPVKLISRAKYLFGRMQFGLIDLLSPLNICAIYAILGLRYISPGGEANFRNTVKKYSKEIFDVDENLVYKLLPASSLLGAFIWEAVLAIAGRFSLPQILLIEIARATLLTLYQVLGEKVAFSNTQLAFKPMFLYTLVAIFPFVGGTAMLGLSYPTLLPYSVIRLSLKLYYPSALTAIISSAIYANKYGDGAIGRKLDGDQSSKEISPVPALQV